MMFNLGERVKHLDTGSVGIVIGYGKRIVDKKCLEIAKVRLIDSTSNRGITVKDAYAKWLPYPEDYRISAPYLNAIHSNAKLIKRYDFARSA